MFRVLYVDDDPVLLEIGKLYLERDGQFSVDIIASAPAALDLIRSTPYDAIISDYQMPVMDGIGFLQKVRSSGDTTPFILFTGRGREEVVIQALNEGADFYLQKGGDPKPQFTELSHKIRQAVQRRKAEISIRDHERREAEILNFLPDATFAIDTDGVVIAWNRAMEQMTGVAASSMLGKGNYEYALPFYHERRPILIDLVLKDLPAIVAQYPYVKREGGHLFSEISLPRLNTKKDVSLWFTASPLYGDGGAVIGAIESIRDITSRRKAEAALRESEGRYRNVVEDQTEFISRFLPDGTHIFVNEAYCRYFHKKRDDIIGKKFIPAIPADERSRVRDHFSSLTKENPTAIIEHRIIMPDGSVRWQRWSDRAIFSEPGELLEYQSVGRDVTEIKLAEEERRKSAATLASIFRAAPVGIGVLSDRVFLRVNDRLCEMTGYTREELIGNSARMLYPDDAEYDFVGKVKYDQIREKGTGTVETRWKFRDGSLHTILLSSTPLDPADLRAGVTFTALDITERTRSEQALRASEEKYRLIADNTADNIWIFGMDFRLQYISPSVRKIKGFSPEEVMAQSLEEMLTPASLAAVLKRFEEEMALEAGGTADPDRTVSFESEEYCRDGSIIQVENTAVLLRDEHRRPVGILGISRDITQRKRVEEALRESEEKYRTLADNLPDYVIIHRDGTILYANQACAEATGVPVEDLTGQSALAFIAPEHRDLVAGKIPHGGSRGEKRTYDAAIVVKNGGKRHGLISSTTIAFGGAPASLVVISDITEQKQAENALRAANRQLSLMAGITRHDISNQIQVILGLLEISKAKSRDPVTGSFTRKLESAAKAIRSQIEFTRVYHDLGSRAPQWLAPEKLLEILKVPQTITVISRVEGLEILADPLLEKVFSNLLDNSVRHGERVTEIRVSFAGNGDDLTLVWEDNGAGIPAGEKEQIFERGVGKNTGYGLFLVREILALTGISIRETGEPGTGARFELAIPAASWRMTDGPA
jgi:PAS domain S-box-containing protein